MEDERRYEIRKFWMTLTCSKVYKLCTSDLNHQFRLPFRWVCKKKLDLGRLPLRMHNGMHNGRQHIHRYLNGHRSFTKQRRCHTSMSLSPKVNWNNNMGGSP